MRKIFRLLHKVAFGWVPGGARVCVMCGHHVWRFMPYRDGFRVVSMDALGFISGDMANFGCPRCGSHDRERHLKLYMEASGIAKGVHRMRVLHFAPEVGLGLWVRSLLPASYVACDLNPVAAHIIRVDAEDIPYQDQSFDLVIANHVLEHVGDDRKALSEIRRVLAPGGFAILQTPYSSVAQETWSDKGIMTPVARLHAFGQEDHVRLYGRDIFSRFESTGFASHVKTHSELLFGLDARVHGVGINEPFFLFQRVG